MKLYVDAGSKAPVQTVIFYDKKLIQLHGHAQPLYYRFKQEIVALT